MKKFAFGFILSLVFSATAFAQSGPCPTSLAVAVNPNWVCVDPGTDYLTNDPVTGAPIVSRLDLLFFAPGVDSATGAPIQTINIGKPTLTNGVAWLQRAELQAIPVGQQYRARLVAVGPDGVSGRSPESNPFGRKALQVPLAPDRVSVVP